MTIVQVAAIVLPLVVPIALGWLAVRTGLLGREAAHPLTTIFMYICGPALLIVVLSAEDLSELLDVRLILATVAFYVIGFGGIRRLRFQRGSMVGSRSQSGLPA